MEGVDAHGDEDRQDSPALCGPTAAVDRAHDITFDAKMANHGFVTANFFQTA